MEEINHPQHYGGDTPHEVIKCLHAWGLENDALLWNVVKYIARARLKQQFLKDLKKAKFYLERRIKEIEEIEERAKNVAKGTINEHHSHT